MNTLPEIEGRFFEENGKKYCLTRMLRFPVPGSDLSLYWEFPFPVVLEYYEQKKCRGWILPLFLSSERIRLDFCGMGKAFLSKYHALKGNDVGFPQRVRWNFYFDSKPREAGADRTIDYLEYEWDHGFSQSEGSV